MTSSPSTSPRTADRPRPVKASRAAPAQLLEKYALVILLVGLVILFAIWVPQTFTNPTNIRTLLQSQSINAVVAFAVIVPLTTGRFDLSVGATLTLSSMVGAGLMSRQGLSLPIAIAGAVGVGLIIGLINGFFIARVGVDSLVVTLATATVIGGIIDIYAGGQIISTGLSPALTRLGTTLIAGWIPALFAIMAVIAVAVWYLLTRTPFGRRLQSIGSNERSAVLVGINVRKVIWSSFVVSGGLGALAGVLQIASQGSANPSAGGISSMLPALAGAFLGATVFTVGRYNVPGTLVGLFVVAVLVNGMALVGAPPSMLPIVNGIAVLIAVSLSTILRRRRLGEAFGV